MLDNSVNEIFERQVKRKNTQDISFEKVGK